MGDLNVESRSLFIADNLEVLRGINSETIDLIATDPPFNKGVKAFQGITTAGTDAEGRRVSYKDVWTWADDVQGEWTESIREDHPSLYAVIRAANAAAGEDMGAYLCWLGVRVLEMHRILKPTGSMYLHIDHTAHAYAKAMMDAVFGRGNFRNEIVWTYRRWPAKTPQWQKMHDTILWYSKGTGWTWNQLYEPLSESTQKTWGTKKQVADFSTGRRKPSQTDKESPGAPMRSVWDIRVIAPISKERTGYPTQKPLALYERIIKASSNEGDVVLDPFAGCATTCIAAERLGRDWIAIDINKEAKDVMLERLRKEAQLPQGSQSHERAISVKTELPTRTDDGVDAAPELVLISPKPKAPRYTARELRGRLILEDGMKCQGCGWVPHHEEYLEVDHRVPKSKGGRDGLRNRVLLCSPCNSAKGNKLTLPELRQRRLEEKRMEDEAWDWAWYEQIGKFG